MPKVRYNKPALTYEEQLQQLKNRGLRIENDQKALHLLENISYYRLSAYWYPMLAYPKSAHTFKQNSSFDESFKLYCFDRELRKLIVGELEKIEVSVRAKMSYILAHRHGPFWYENKDLFKDQDKLANTIQKLKQEQLRSDEEFIKAFRKKYANPYPPSWMLLEVSSFGILSNLYKNLSAGRNKRDIASYFGLDDSTFESWLHSLTYVRNICAHHSRLWNKKMSIQPQVPLKPSNLFITIVKHPDSLPGKMSARLNDKTYFILCIIIYLLNTINPNHTFKDKLQNLFLKYPNVDKRAMGFPAGWEEELIWS